MSDIAPNVAYRFKEFYIPAHMMGGLSRYVEHGIAPGDFLCAVITNDLFAAVQHADHENAANLPAYAAWFYNEAPSACYGCREAMDRWIEAKREEHHAS